MKDKVRSGIPLSLTQASITPWISANTVEPKPNKLDECQKVKGRSEFASRLYCKKKTIVTAVAINKKFT